MKLYLIDHGGVLARSTLTVGSHREIYRLSACLDVPIAFLGLLERKPSHGYELKREYDAFFGKNRPLPFGQVYATGPPRSRQQSPARR